MLGTQKLSKSISKNKHRVHSLKVELPQGKMPEAGTSFLASVRVGETKSGSPEQVLTWWQILPGSYEAQSQIFSGVKQTQWLSVLT